MPWVSPCGRWYWCRNAMAPISSRSRWHPSGCDFRGGRKGWMWAHSASGIRPSRRTFCGSSRMEQAPSVETFLPTGDPKDSLVGSVLKRSHHSGAHGDYVRAKLTTFPSDAASPASPAPDLSSCDLLMPHRRIGRALLTRPHGQKILTFGALTVAQGTRDRTIIERDE